MSVSPIEEERVQRFKAAFNGIETELKDRTGKEDSDSFVAAVRAFVRANPSWRADSRKLEAYADLRNVLVHDFFERGKYPTVPTEWTVVDIEAIKERLTKPPLAGEEFNRDVQILDIDDTLEDFLQHVRHYDFTQFPVYGNGEFKGLVTSNGVTRWIADRVQEKQLDIVEFSEHAVGDLLASEEERDNVDFVRRGEPVYDVAYMFQENPQLEAVLVTQRGERDEKLLGIVTQWDIAKLPKV